MTVAAAGTGLTRGFVVLAVLAAFAAAGCAVDEQREVAQYRAVLDGTDQPVPVEFTTGQPLTLDTALRLANAHNERLQFQGEAYLQSLIDKDRAFASFLPTVTLVPSYSRADDQGDRSNGRSGDDVGDPSNPDDQAGGGGGRGGGSTATGSGNFDLPVNVRMNLFNGFRDLATLRARGSEIDRQRALLLDLQHTILLEVAQTYYRVLRAERAVQVLRNSVAVQEERVRDARARARIGMSRPLEVAQFEAQAAATRVSLINAQNDVRNSRTLLAYLVDARVGDSPLVDEFQLPPDLAPADEYLREAEAARQDVRAAESAIGVAEQNVRAAVGQYYPSVQLNFNAYLYRESQPDTSVWNGLISANLPVFTGGIIHANVRTALSRLRQAVTFFWQTRLQAEQDVLIAHENVLAAAAREAELRVQFEAAQQALRLAEGRGQVGQGTNLERLIAQDQLLTAELELSSQQFDRKVLYLNLLRAAGKLGTSATTAAVASPATAPATVPAAS
jgi:outer membrane protein